MREAFRVTVNVDGKRLGPYTVTAEDALVAIAVVKFQMYQDLKGKRRLIFEAEPWENNETVQKVTHSIPEVR